MRQDTVLRCERCGRESTTSFASSLATGWERCCGYTMTLVRTDADIDAIAGEMWAKPDPVVFAFKPHYGPEPS